MSYSLNEIEALAKRATRGAGLPWGLAEEAAMATRWLASFDLPGPELLASLLKQDDSVAFANVTPISLDGQWSGASGRLSPLICGAALSDVAGRLKDAECIMMENVSHPLLLLPFAAGAARQIGSAVSLEWGDVLVASDGKVASITGSQEALNRCEVAHVVVRANASTSLSGAYKPRLRGLLSDDCLNRLQGFAMRAFAPITDRSRDLGAGSELSDND